MYYLFHNFYNGGFEWNHFLLAGRGYVVTKGEVVMVTCTVAFTYSTFGTLSVFMPD